MPSVETFDCTQDAVHWRKSGYDNYGEFKVLDPIAIKVRWNDDIKDGLDPKGHKISLVATISCLVELTVGGIVWNGALGDLPASPSPLYQINEDISGLDIKNRRTRYLYTLSRFRDTLPDGVAGTGT